MPPAAAASYTPFCPSVADCRVDVRPRIFPRKSLVGAVPARHRSSPAKKLASPCEPVELLFHRPPVNELDGFVDIQPGGRLKKVAAVWRTESEQERRVNTFFLGVLCQAVVITTQLIRSNHACARCLIGSCLRGDRTDDRRRLMFAS